MHSTHAAYTQHSTHTTATHVHTRSHTHKNAQLPSTPSLSPPPQIAGGHKYLPPRSDVNAPDLYIPFMAACTYVLLAAAVRTAGGTFTPDTMYATVRDVCVCVCVMCVCVRAMCVRA